MEAVAINDPSVVLAGGSEITVAFVDGDEREVSRDVVKVRQVPVRHIGKLGQLWGNEGAEVDIYCAKPDGWHATLSEPSYLAVLELGRQLNRTVLGNVFGEFNRLASPGKKKAAVNGNSSFLEAFEWLISQGYHERDLLDYSPEKLELMFSLAKKRVRKERATQDLRTLRLLRTAIVSVISEDGRQHYMAVDDKIESELEDESPKAQQAKGLAYLQKTLRAIGAKCRN